MSAAGAAALLERARVPVDVQPGPQDIPEHWHRLHFTMKRQSETNWCWAATAASVVEFYQPSTTWTQCVVVCTTLNNDNCCDKKSSCNTTGYLSPALRTVGCQSTSYVGALSYDWVDETIQSGNPVCVQIQWPDTTSHYLAITGIGFYDYLEVGDSWYGPSFTTYQLLSMAYQGTGTWIWSCVPQPPTGGSGHADPVS